jgi:precorrin-6B methylase 2
LPPRGRASIDDQAAVPRRAPRNLAAARAGVDRRAAEYLLNALVALKTLKKKGGVYCNTPAAARFLAGDAPESARAALMHTVHLWESWSTLTECVRAGTAVGRPERGKRRLDWTPPFIAAMHRNALLRAPAVMKALDLSGVERVLDVGGGSGAYSIAFARASAGLSAVVFDLPGVVPLAERNIALAGMTGRVTTRAGDMHADDLGAGFDLVFISAICHMNSPDQNKALFRKAFAALVPGGRTVVQDFVVDPDGTAPRHAVLFGINMLVNTEAGGVYTERDYRGWLREAGFTALRRLVAPGASDMIVGRRPLRSGCRP